MNNQHMSLLTTWYQNKDSFSWVLATIIETKGSSYRKSGAMMLFNSLGKSYGLLSGGCLEADLLKQAQKCLQLNQAISVCYDMRDESDIAWQLGIGCGGMVKVLLQPINKTNNYLDLPFLYKQLQQNLICYYQISSKDNDFENTVLNSENLTTIASSSKVFTIKPRTRLVVFGGGIDAIPVINIAKQMDWHITLIDSRTAYARKERFKDADTIIQSHYQQSTVSDAVDSANAIVIMHHNIHLDAQALDTLTSTQAKFIGLLGPQHRTDRVFAQASISAEQLPCQLANPIGLDLGGELPEAIALSIIAQIQAQLENASCMSLGLYTTASKDISHAS
ncbi:XdhC family protein [Litorilituus sediminis]|uniref:XdhC/CoxI family protein n=1 Tax=Litorilituus sediminis TaxID=718192 RepID=A0A4P6P5P1_9GAMM|nr:XdhC/CoxI family protein [Litorilituus sediminis]QBG34757.1 XdhC/CoxI family protein [Litorilituus sediminis]